MAPEDDLVRTFLCRSPEETRVLGRSLGAVLEGGTVLALHGDLGSGKTCFTGGVALGLGIEDPVTSPTFALLATYEGRLPLQHFDAWMEGRERAFLADGGADCLAGEGVAVVEWAERVEEWLPRPYLRAVLEHRGETERAVRLSVVGEGARGASLRACLAALEARGGALEGPAAGGIP
ncbi:MAG: tRNA (adenosine(37)-N6)-threonylcarbamoyltransferase complex ATPase subunit type 1 TsaE [Planctomycetota bacterium]|jgi:tRNA threonylcarbamoyladenosine biosynthesis protein TsaE|nr:tRNA (adenosine(37)-N6)-threonylcarbamoyltransferase complex ATPase subunit type 1 TsaE [Planctomycetota bacterium]MDP6764040.1 tRNA (adenosine(37)-N6)-threonylcarbamoyltransferase complex ATPase subunit type 1 TsaE [Planctomycetota bacterium]MDP6988008.1 tRNA (adenosine(37)-N6)-threonylcarbamoyltransferase complex ATPase subunit type 1 TsaE [Planctomycetota bacterium]